MSVRRHFGQLARHLTDSEIVAGQRVNRRLFDMGNGYFLEVGRAEQGGPYHYYLCGKNPQGMIERTFPRPKLCIDTDEIFMAMDAAAECPMHENAAIGLRPDIMDIRPVSHSAFEMCVPAQAVRTAETGSHRWQSPRTLHGRFG